MKRVMATKKYRFYSIFFDGLQPFRCNYKEIKEPTLKSNNREVHFNLKIDNLLKSCNP